jgi:hypothetical protein
VGAGVKLCRVGGGKRTAMVVCGTATAIQQCRQTGLAGPAVCQTKFTIVPKSFLLDLKIFCPKEIDLFSFQIFFESTLSSV